ncbi:hypothetical protein OS493_015121 [Desmophyllum pertusum]|uniref:Uncharacterized protein n=1 Tax=Desmophyllum pertusum TaxID=174260 RepID=A0A9W9ZPQ2_9CNID|nr:hypothetical protein OS493_015121 [Desmophyllum pertusum]
MGSGFALKKLNAAHNARDHRTRAVDGVPILFGLSHSEMTPITEMEAVITSGESRHTPTSDQARSIVSAFKRRKEARSVKEHATRAPVGAQTRLGPAISVMTQITEVAVVVTLGRSSLEVHLAVYLLLGTSQRVECASKRQRAAPSAREIVKAVVDGPQARILPGHHHFEMIQMGALEAVLIVGT